MNNNEDELHDTYEEISPPVMVDEDLRETQELPRVTQNVLRKDSLRETSEHKVLRNIAKSFRQY